MNIIEKNLRRLVPDEIKALLEKIDSLEDHHDSSFYSIKEYARRARLTWLEKFLLDRGVGRIERRAAMVSAMDLVLNQGYGAQWGATQSPLSLNLREELREELAKSIHATGNVVQSTLYGTTPLPTRAGVQPPSQPEADRRVVVRRKPAA